MEIVKKENCLRCGSIDVHNQVYLQGGRNIQIFVECAVCGHLIARYALKRYSTSERRFSFLEYYRKKGYFGGKRRILKEVGAYKNRIRNGWGRVKRLMAENETDAYPGEMPGENIPPDELRERSV